MQEDVSDPPHLRSTLNDYKVDPLALGALCSWSHLSSRYAGHLYREERATKSQRERERERKRERDFK